MAGLSDKQAKFVAEYIGNGGNGAAAARAAGYSEKTADRTAYVLLRKPEISAAVASVAAPARAVILADAARVVKEWAHIATADSRELVEYHRGACRYCWSDGHRYHRTPAERELAWADHQQMLAATDPQKWRSVPAFDEMGGVGYDPRKAPHPDCPECAGDGVGRTVVRDTRTLSPAAASLYAGVKQTRDGIEVKQHDKATALDRLAKVFKVAGFGPGDGDEAPALHLHVHLVRLLQGLSPDDQEAMRPLLAKLVGSGSTTGG